MELWDLLPPKYRQSSFLNEDYKNGYTKIPNVIRLLIPAKVITAFEYVVLDHIWSFSRIINHRSSRAEIARLLSISRNAVNKAIKKLLGLKLITEEKITYCKIEYSFFLVNIDVKVRCDCTIKEEVVTPPHDIASVTEERQITLPLDTCDTTPPGTCDTTPPGIGDVTIELKYKNSNKELNNKKEKGTLSPASSSPKISGKVINEASEQFCEKLNAIANSKYKPTSKQILKDIERILREGYEISEMLEVIDKKHGDWKGTEFYRHMSPDTLLGPKFGKYAGAPQASTEGFRSDGWGPDELPF